MEKMALLCFVLCLVTLAHEAQGRNIFRRPSLDQRDLQIERQLKILNKPAVKSFKTEHGVIFDCVDIYKQPAFDHPLLKNHTLQTKLSSDAEGLFRNTSKGAARTNFSLKAKCPSGTVLIRRTTKEDLLRAYYSDKIHFPQSEGSMNHFAVLMFRGARGHKYYGAQALMDVYQIDVDSNQNSSAQIIVYNHFAGPLDTMNIIQFGWHIYPLLTGDSLPHLFIRWTSDGYLKTGCLNMLCQGFVQTSRSVTPGMAIQPGKAALKLTLYKDNTTRNWVLVQENPRRDMVGYWPADLFNKMDDASTIQVGGVANELLGTPSPPMGSGILPKDKGACEFRQVAFMHQPGAAFTVSEEAPDIIVDLPEIYGIGGAGDLGGDIGYRFEFGGPGAGS